MGTREAPQVERSLATLIERTAPELIVASGDLTHRGTPDQHAARRGVPALPRPARSRDPREPRHPVQLPGALHPHLRRVRAPVGDDRARLPLADAARGRVELRARLASPVGRNPGDTALAGTDAPRGGAGGRIAGRHAAPSPDRSAVALAQEAGRPPLARPRLARRRRRRADPRGAHPPGRGQRAARVRGHPRRCARRGRVGRARPGPTASQRRGEARGLHVYECDETSILVQTHIWRSDDWGLTAVRRFARGREPLAVD